MTILKFDLPLKSAELQNIDVPVEVRDLKMHLIGETTTTGTLVVEEGKRYVVTARLPAGQTIAEFVDADGSEVTVRLPLQEEEESVQEWEEVPTYFASKRAQRASAPKLLRRTIGRGMEMLESVGLESMQEEAPAPVLPQATMHFFAGNVLAGNALPIPIAPERQQSSDALAELVIPAAAEPRWLHCSYGNGSTINIALPVSNAGGCTISIHRETTRYWIEVHPRHPNANLLIGYAQNRLGEDEAKLAERLLYDKFEDPIAAAVGAYSLLRVSSLERLHDWTANLMNFFPWLPDGAAIRGEHLARRGKHEAAVEAFIEVANRGLPIFADGVRFTDDRLRLYAHESSEMPAVQDRLEEARRRLKKFIRAIDFTKSVTTFAGCDPNRPRATDAAPLPEGMEVAALFAV